jgi:hypothetical protein
MTAMADRRGRTFAPLPPGVVRVRLQGGSAGDLASQLTSMPGVRVVTGPDAYDGDRLYLTVALEDGAGTTSTEQPKEEAE